ncbi:TetR/AcrR family transcriptional regulator [Atopomonas sediminilitoris]|uniref:TetR/AcrR family transcriptional regulator n=1 Tax=Atopomonas sediminilitoris TaxID=2919919 RepID=UPI001F4DD88F|nr:TetR/AcrR family transcriptional regulator [Atopomonas sediminilitoris]MCJ8170595.1 TetR/AcrR family transcriptional regulator [Atopomonas sediminilitoris]
MEQTTDLLQRCYPSRRAELKRTILRTALACFNQHGIEATTIEQVRAQCDASVGAIYHHFGNKEGLVAALFFTALDDQAALREAYLAKADTLEQVVHALVHSYVDWVSAQPDWARFQFLARFAVSKGPLQDELLARNRTRNQQLRERLSVHGAELLQDLPKELIASLIVGPAENYCRAWLSGRVSTSPSAYRDALAAAVWRALGGLESPAH